MLKIYTVRINVQIMAFEKFRHQTVIRFARIIDIAIRNRLRPTVTSDKIGLSPRLRRGRVEP